MISLSIDSLLNKCRSQSSMTTQDNNNQLSAITTTTTTMATNNNGDEMREKRKSLVERITRSLKVKWYNNKKRSSDAVTDNDDKRNELQKQTYGSSSPSKKKMSRMSDSSRCDKSSYGATTDSDTSLTSTSKSLGDSSIDENHHFDYPYVSHERQRSGSSLASIASTPMQLLTTRANEIMMKRKSLHPVWTVSNQMPSREADDDERKETITNDHDLQHTSIPPTRGSCEYLISLVADVWESSIYDIPREEHSAKSALFSGKKKSTISLRAYMARMVRIINNLYEESSNETKGAGIRSLMICTLYMGRLMELNEDLIITEFNVHRLFLASYMIALKMFEDELPRDLTLAEYGGVSVQQLQLIQSRFLQLIHFNLFVEAGEYQAILSKAQVLLEANYIHDASEFEEMEVQV